MSEPKRAKLDKADHNLKYYSHLPNNVKTIVIKGTVDMNLLQKIISQISTNFVYGHFQSSNLNQQIQQKHSNIRFLSVKLQEELFIYVIAHPTVCTEQDIVNILNRLITSYEQQKATTQFTITTPDENKWQTQLPYWKNQLQNTQLDLNLSMYFTSSENSSENEVAKFNFQVNGSEIEKFCDQFQVQPSFFFFSIFQVFLYKYTHQDIFSLHSFISSYFNNSICIPCKISSDQTFHDLLKHVKINLDDHSQVTNVPFQLVKSQILDNKNININFTYYQNIPQISNGLNISWHKYDLNTTLGLDISENGTNFHCVFYYDRKLFCEDKINKMSVHFQQLLNYAIKNSTEKISIYSLLTPKDKLLFQKWNNTQNELNLNVSINKMFENQVEKSGDKIAVMCDTKSITYYQLNHQTNLLSTHLYSIGINHGSVIGVCMEKCIDLIAIYLAILKIGGCYVPIDPLFPTQRIQFLLDNSNVQFILTQESLKDKLPNTRPIFLFDYLDSAKNEANFRHFDVSQTAPAYIVHTSGTTGKPKGVVATQRNVITFINGMMNTFNPDQSKGILISASPNFCLFHGLLYYALAQGSAIILAPSLMHLPEIKFKDEVTFIATPPTGFRRLMDEKNLPKSLKIVLFGGDDIPSDLVRDLQQNRPDIQIFTCHGCTEATLFDLCGIVNKIPSKRVSAGRPMPNMKIYILDKDMQRVPVDFVGQLGISGPQVAEGYLNLEEETSVKFLKNPFEFENNFYKKIYLTGDLARWTNDGEVEIMGRINDMVKINGIRIELNEISTVLRQHDAILEAVVSVSEINNTKLLIAYYVPKTDFVVEDYLKLKLPHYMIPQIYIKMEKLPRNINGKVDRNLLPSPCFENTSDDVINPQTQTELSTLAQIEKLLNQPLKLTDNLLEKGLDSILATQLVINLEKTFQIKLPVSLIYDGKNALSLCKNIESIMAGNKAIKINVDLQKEAILKSEITGESAHIFDLKRAVNPNYILLTGATGFIGSFILTELLTKTKAHIYCLVRGENSVSAFDRLKQNLQFYNLWKSEFESNVTAIVGDVNKTNLGLSPNEYETMTSIIDSIYHSAATVNFILPYSAMKNDVNEILKFALAIKIKPFHYISSIAVHGNRNEHVSVSKVFEDTDLNTNISFIPNNGYSQIKWVSEQLVHAAAARGLPVTIFRPSFVFADSVSGSISSQEFVTRFIKDCIDMKLYPNVDVPLQLIPVDFVSKSVVQISLDAANFGKVFHLTPSLKTDVSVCQLMELIVKCGYEMEKISCLKWLELLEMNVNCALYPLLEFVKGYVLSNRNCFWEFDVSNVKNALQNSDIEVKLIDLNYVKMLLDFLTKCDFLRK